MDASTSITPATEAPGAPQALGGTTVPGVASPFSSVETSAEPCDFSASRKAAALVLRLRPRDDASAERTEGMTKRSDALGCTQRGVVIRKAGHDSICGAVACEGARYSFKRNREPVEKVRRSSWARGSSIIPRKAGAGD